MRRLNDPGSLGIALTQARGGPFSTRRLSLIASVILGSGERRFHGGSDDAQRSGWVTFAGFKYQFVAARPDDSNVHLGAGRALRRVTLCDKRARSLWLGAGGCAPTAVA
jgi:hypothetical protein